MRIKYVRRSNRTIPSAQSRSLLFGKASARRACILPVCRVQEAESKTFDFLNCPMYEDIIDLLMDAFFNRKKIPRLSCALITHQHMNNYQECETLKPPLSRSLDCRIFVTRKALARQIVVHEKAFSRFLKAPCSRRSLILPLIGLFVSREMLSSK